MVKFFIALALIFELAHPTVSTAGDTGNTVGQEAPVVAKSGKKFKQFLADTFGRPDRSQRAAIVPVEFSRSWLDAQPLATGNEQWRCLSEALYFEARGETVKGQFAVAEIILNRVKSSRFPGSLCAVIKQGTGRKYQCQFTYTCDGYKEVIAEQKAFERVSKVARAAMDGGANPLTNGATYYHTVSVRPSWAKKFTETARIGVHIFYRPHYRTASND